VVLALDDNGGEVILTGRGLGHGARPGHGVNRDKIVRVFKPDAGSDPDHLADALASIPPEHVHLVGTAMHAAGLQARASASPTLVVALADHISFALKRRAIGMDITYPLLSEVTHLYPEEYGQARSLLTAVNSELDDPLDDGEAIALALHLVNAGFATGDISWTYTMTGVIQQLVEVIEQTYDLRLDEKAVSIGRFVTHLRYLFVRISQHSQLAAEHSAIGAAIQQAHPSAFECAQRLAGILELRLGSALTDDEVTYLTLHVARVAQDAA
ncbi:MAG: PRD domain-containing protein, partial [Propioniciclava sp.]